MTLEKAIDINADAYWNWRCNGMPEADDELNDSNVTLIRAYKERNPAAMGYKMHTGIVNIPNKIYNFCFEFLLNGNDTELINELNAETDELKRLDILHRNGAIALTWS